MRGSSARQRGVTLPELIVVVALLGLVALVAVPRILETIHFAKARNVAEQLEISLRAVRMIAVSTQADHGLEIFDDTDGRRFRYVDINGRERRFLLPSHVEYESFPASISYTPTGALSTGGQQVVIRAALGGAYTDRWTIVANPVGNIQVLHEKIDPPILQ